MIDRNKTQIIEKEKTQVVSYRLPRAVWGAIFAGVVMVTVIQLTLALLGSAIGLSMVNPQEGMDAVQDLGIGATVWWLISGLIAFFAGGWIAGRLAGIPRPWSGALHGLVMWGTTALLSFMLLTGALGALIGGSFSLLKAGGGAVAGAAPEIAQSIGQNVNINLETMPGGEVISDIRQEINQLPAQQGANAEPQIMAALTALVLAPQGNESGAREALINQLTNNTELSAAEARNRVGDWEQRLQPLKQQAQQNLQQAGQQAGQAVETAGDVAATGALASFFMLLLGAAAAGWGGYLGTPHWSEEAIV